MTPCNYKLVSLYSIMTPCNCKLVSLYSIMTPNNCKLVSLYSIMTPSNCKLVYFFAKSFNKLTIRLHSRQNTLGSSYLKGLHSHPLWVTLYITEPIPYHNCSGRLGDVTYCVCTKYLSVYL